MTARAPSVPPALSTMWHQRFPTPADLRPFFTAARAMGFDRFELSHTHPSDALATIPPEIVIASVHHPCPNDGPLALGPGDDATSPDPAARARWRDALRRTIETARRLGAGAVCAHLGGAHDETVRQLWFELHSRYQAGQADSPRYGQALAELRARLAEVEPAAIERAAAVLSGVVDDLRSAGVALGVETGYHAWELPTAGGMAALLAAIDAAVPGAALGPDAVIGAWLDTGHVGAQVNVGTATFDGWFEAVRGIDARWVGVHWHRVVGVRDHLAGVWGRSEAAAVLAGIQSAGRGVHHTLEVDWYFDPSEVEEAARSLRAALDGG